VEYAHVLKDLADIHFANAKTIVLVQDNLNIHSKASLYEAFPAAEARRLVERFEWHYTPKHGSWLDLAESELGVLSSQCLDRRIPDKETLIGVAIRDFEMAPAFERSKHHEEVGGAVALVFVVEASRAPWLHRDRHSRFGNEWLRGLVHTN